MDIVEDGATVDNSSFLTGNPALRILGNQVRFTNKAGGWIFSNPDQDQSAPVVQLTGSQIVFINEYGGNIRARDDTHLVLEGSQYADHIENYGILQGKVSLGGGDDYYYGLIDLSLNQPTSFDLGDGDDRLVLDVSGSNSVSFTNIEGGAGYDRVAITGYHLYPSGYPSQLLVGQLTGIERIDFGGIDGGATSLKIEALHTSADIYLAPAMSLLVNAYFAPGAIETGAIHLDGGDINIMNGASIGDIFGGGDPEWVRIGVDGNTGVPLDVGATWLGGGSDSFTMGYGDLPSMEVHGGDDADLVRGGELADSLSGDGGDDVLRGGGGADILDGGAGDDRIDGGIGGDSLIGGSGADRFIFNAAPGAANIDTVADFEIGIDRIYLSPFAFSNISISTLASYQFHVGTQSLHSLTRIIYNDATGALLYDKDGTGGIAAVHFASIAPGLALTNQDFTLASNINPTFREAGRPIVRISTGPNGEQGDGQSSNGVYAPNGRFVAFESSATNLVAGDTNGKSDIFIKNLQSGSVFRLSLGPSQAEANGNSSIPIFSADGLKLVYQSAASNLVAGDTPGTTDLFVFDFTTGETRLVSSNAAGAFGNGASFGGGFSPDGTKFVFTSAASNLVAGDVNGTYDIFIKDLASGAVTLVASAGPLLSGIGKPVFSPDGSKILFQSEASDLVAGDTNGKADLFIKDLVTGTITRVSTSDTGAEGDHISSDGTFSPDGTRILFQSAASNLVAGDANNNFDVFIKDLSTGQITLVSGFGATVGNGGSTKAVFSPDGGKVAFYSLANNLVAGDTNGNFDIFVKDLTDGSIIRVSVSAAGLEGNDSSYMPSFSPDGMSLIFHSAASNLVAGDTNGAFASYDTFIVDIGSRYTENGAEAVIATSLVVADDSDNYQGGWLTTWVSAGLVSGDQITLAAVGGVSVAGTQVSVNAVVVGMIDISGSTLRIMLNANADDAAVAALTRALRFSSTSDAPGTGTRTIMVQLADGGGDGDTHYSASFTHQVAVTEVNDAPVLAASAGKAAFTEGVDGAASSVAVDPGLVITDVDASRITDATINVTVGATGDLLGFVNNNGAAFGDISVFASNGGALQLHSNGGATLAQWQNALRAVTFTSTEDAPITSDRTVSFILRDSDATDHGILSNYASRQVTITAANDSPVNHLPAAQSVDENQVLTFSAANGNAITISDGDAVGFAMTVTIDVADGALTLASPYFFQTGDGGNHLVLMGSVDQVNAALEGLTYTPVTNANGQRSITVTTGDGGQAGAVNLILNPGAETGTAGSLGSNVPPAGWTIVSGHMSAVLYDPPGGANLVADSSYAGTDYFAGGTGNPGGAPAVASQTIDLSAFAGQVPSLADIDAGLVRANLSGWFGGRGAENDNMVFKVRFLSAGGQELGTAEIGGVLAAERGGQTILLPREAISTLPAGTRSIELILTANHATGPYIDAYADQLSLTLSKVDVDSFGVNIIPDPHDIVFGTPGADNMAAGPGNDIYHVNNAGDVVIEAFNEGNDVVYASVSYALTAGSYVELLATESSAGTETIHLTGNDRDNAVWGNAGDNLLSGGGGIDSLLGFAGNDTLIGGAGADQMSGGAGNDTYFVDNAGDTVIEAAGEGYDVVAAGVTWTLGAGVSVELLTTGFIAGTASIDFTGNELANQIWGNDGANTINGGGGNDELFGFGGNDTLIGGTGNDTMFVTEAGDIVVEGVGEGYDVVAAGVSYVLAAGAEIELLTTGFIGGTAAIDFTSNEFANQIWGNAAGNILNGRGGNDALFGFGGNDILVGGAGADLLAGGTGNDTMFVDDAGDIALEGVGEGYDVVAAGLSYTLRAGSEIELLTTGFIAGTASIDFTGNELANQIWGNDGVNILNGAGGNDELFGFGGNDTLIGGTGNDTMFIDSAGDTIVEAAGEGYDTLAAGVSYVIAAGAEIELLTTGFIGGIATIDFTANDFANQIWGNAAGNSLNGGGGNDALFGFDGNDTLVGGNGSDALFGGNGADTFAFTTALGAANVDLIADFVSGTDKIALDDAIFTGLGLGALSANAFVNGTSAQDADDRILYDAATGNLFLDADGNGAGAAVLFATLQGHPVLAASDFQVI
ncbi:MAG TPA: hypothetical protein VIT38_11820 [Allosphingosinicella sp.]